MAVQPKNRAEWMALGPRITELSAAGLGNIEICVELGIDPARNSQTHIAIVLRALGLPPMKRGSKPGKAARADAPSSSWTGYRITSDWRDPKCVERDMGGKRFEDVTFRARRSAPIFVPARRSAPSAGVADYLGAR